MDYHLGFFFFSFFFFYTFINDRPQDRGAIFVGATESRYRYACPLSNTGEDFETGLMNISRRTP